MKGLERFSVLTFLFAVLLGGSLGQSSEPKTRSKPASKEELAGTEARGRMLYEYDQAAWHSTDAVVALKASTGFTSFVGRKVDGKWVVVYGKVDNAANKYLVLYEAKQGESPTEFSVNYFAKPKGVDGYFLNAARAFELGRKEFGKTDRAYNTAVLPADDGKFYVYLMPAQTTNGVYPLGGDVRYLVSKDGKTVIERRQLHITVLEFASTEADKPSGAMHTALLDEVPEDTDVFHVLTRQPRFPQWILSKNFVYIVKEDGTLMYLMTVEAYKRIGNKEKQQ